MVERLIQTLQALASPPEVQLARFPDFVARADELALDFDDALRLVYDCPQIQLEPTQRRYLDRLNRYLDERSGRTDNPFWTEAAIRQSAEWATLRELARDALTSLDAPLDVPPPADAAYVRSQGMPPRSA